MNELASDAAEAVRAEVATSILYCRVPHHHAERELSILQRLSLDASPEVRITTAEALVRRSAEYSDEARALLDQLAQDSDPHVRAAATQES